jgi:hypothetical protein
LGELLRVSSVRLGFTGQQAAVTDDLTLYHEYHILRDVGSVISNAFKVPGGE